MGPLSCATVVTYTSGGDNAEYSSLVSKASESLAGSGTHIQTTIGMTASAGAGATASESGSASPTSSAGASASSGSQSTPSNGSGALGVQLGFVGAGVLALAVLL